MKLLTIQNIESLDRFSKSVTVYSNIKVERIILRGKGNVIIGSYDFLKNKFIYCLIKYLEA